jgi:hypothetical protein
MIRKLAVIAALATTPILTLAQTAPSAAGPSTAPVADSVRAGLTRYSKNMSAAADAMPADKFAFKPTPDQIPSLISPCTSPNPTSASAPQCPA